MYDTMAVFKRKNTAELTSHDNEKLDHSLGQLYCR